MFLVPYSVKRQFRQNQAASTRCSQVSNTLHSCDLLRLVNEYIIAKAISADMATRLEKAFGGTANAWLQMQNNYDLARARRHEDQLKVQRNAPELARSA